MAVAGVLLCAVLVLVFVPLSAVSASSSFGCVFARDLIERHDLGGNVRYDKGRGPDCSNRRLMGTRLAMMLILGRLRCFCSRDRGRRAAPPAEHVALGRSG